MSTGIIVEYNPMHIGHRIHIQSAKKTAPEEPVVAVMSGYFVQRGEPAIVSPLLRAQIAVTQGVDLVLLLPVVHSIQSAQYFAQGAVDILLSANVSRIVYGSESSSEQIHAITGAIPDPQRFKEKLQSGHSYAGAYGASVDGGYLDANTRLGLAYTEALQYRNSSVPAIPVFRENWHDGLLPKQNQNASHLRNLLHENQTADHWLAAPVPKPYHSINHYEKELRYLLTVSATDPLSYPYSEPGLWERLQQSLTPDTDVITWVEKAASKRHTRARIRRFLLHMLLGLNKKQRDEWLYRLPDAIVPLAMNDRGKEILRSLRDSETPVLSTQKAFHRHIHRNRSVYHWDQKAKQLYEIGML